MTAASPLLLGSCICGEPIFRHRRPDGRQISCADLRRIDQQFFESCAQAPRQPKRELVIVARGGNRDRAVAIAEMSIHRGER
jgi:hypothetical protein